MFKFKQLPKCPSFITLFLLIFKALQSSSLTTNALISYCIVSPLQSVSKLLPLIKLCNKVLSVQSLYMWHILTGPIILLDFPIQRPSWHYEIGRS